MKILYKGLCVSFMMLSMSILPLVDLQAQEHKNKPNIILLLADDHGWGDTGYNGNDLIITPNLDQLASNGIQFDRFYAAAPVCSPTRGSCLTGRHPHRYGIYSANVGRMRPEEITLAEALKTQGYRNGHFGKWHLGTLSNTIKDANRGGRGDLSVFSPPWLNGFDVCFSTESKVPTWDPMLTPDKSAGDIGRRTPGDHFGTHYFNEKGEIINENLQGDDSRVIMDRVIPFINSSVEQETPFFTVVWFHTPHLPVLAGEDYKKLYADLSEDEQHYYGCITAMDEQIGRLMNTLKDLGVADDTMIFYASDNGPEGKIKKGRTQGTAAHLSGRKRSLKEGGVRVPGIWYWPNGINKPMVTDYPASTSDYYPTIMELLDIDMEKQPQLDGTSLLPLVGNKDLERDPGIGFRYYDQISWIQSDFKIYSSDKGETYGLFNISEDPSERIDISTEHPKLKRQMMADLNKWLTSTDKSDRGEDYL